MKFADDEQSVTEYFFRGAKSTSVLTNKRLVIFYKKNEESYPLSKITSVKVGFSRSIGMMISGALLAVIALLLSIAIIYYQNKLEQALPYLDEKAIQGVSGFADEAASARRLIAKGKSFGFPLFFSFGAGISLLFIGWRGETRLEVVGFAGSKFYSAKGNDVTLIDFGQVVAHHLS